MKKSTPILAFVLLAFGMTYSVQANPITVDEPVVEAFTKKVEALAKKNQWHGFSENLIVALKSKHEGLKVAAMGMVIRYGSRVDVKDAVFDVMRIYRNHPNEDMQRMALVALGQMESTWAIEFLERAQRFEKSPVLQQTMRAVINDYHTRHVG